MPTTLLTPPTIDDDLTRRRLLAAAGVAGLLTACAAPASTTDPSATAGYPRTVTTPDDGEVIIEAAPRRIVALNGSRVIPFLLPFLTDETQLVGYSIPREPDSFPWIAEQLRTLPSTPDELALETWASWQPDILIANGNVGDAWEPARAVATLVQLPETDWRATTRLLGEILARPDIAERVIADTEALIAGTRRSTPLTVALISRSSSDAGVANLQYPGAELPNVLAELGVTVAPSATAEGGFEDISMELIVPRLDVDRVVVLNFDDDSQRSLLADPLFRSAESVAAGRVLTLTQQQTDAGVPANPATIPLLIDAFAPLLDD